MEWKVSNEKHTSHNLIQLVKETDLTDLALHQKYGSIEYAYLPNI